MNKITYKEFEKIIHDMGYTISPDYEVNVMVVNNEGEPLLNISKCVYKSLNLDWMTFKKLPDNDKEILADASWALASTPLADREEPKEYYLRLKPEFSYLNGPGRDFQYLNQRRDGDGATFISSNEDGGWFKSKFSSEDIEEFEDKYNLSIFEKVEVTDEELEK